MPKVRGHGGFWAVRVPSPPVDGHAPLPVVAMIVHNAEYEYLAEVELREFRSLGGGGFSEGIPRFRRLEHASFRVAEDDESYPTVLGFTEGKQLDVFCKRGELNQFDLIERTTVQRVLTMNDQKKARWVEIVCRYGRLRRNVRTPRLYSASQTGPVMTPPAPPGEGAGADDEDD